MSELKPCPNPWCEVSAPELYRGGFRNRNVRVQCETCGIHAQSSEFEAEAITAWNTRPREAELEAEVAALGAQVRSAAEAAQVVWSGEHARLEAALRPFLALARAVTVDGSPDFVHWAREAKDWTVAFSFAGHSISLGDLRALAALSHPKGADDGC